MKRITANRYGFHVITSESSLEGFNPNRLDSRPYCCNAGPDEPLQETFTGAELPALWTRLREFNRQALIEAGENELTRWAIIVSADDEEHWALGHTRRTITPLLFRTGEFYWRSTWRPETLIDAPHGNFVDSSASETTYSFGGVLEDVLSSNRFSAEKHEKELADKHGHSLWRVAIAVEWEDLSNDLILVDGITSQHIVSRFPCHQGRRRLADPRGGESEARQRLAFDRRRGRCARGAGRTARAAGRGCLLNLTRRHFITGAAALAVPPLPISFAEATPEVLGKPAATEEITLYWSTWRKERHGLDHVSNSGVTASAERAEKGRAFWNRYTKKGDELTVRKGIFRFTGTLFRVLAINSWNAGYVIDEADDPIDLPPFEPTHALAVPPHIHDGHYSRGDYLRREHALTRAARLNRRVLDEAATTGEIKLWRIIVEIGEPDRPARWDVNLEGGEYGVESTDIIKPVRLVYPTQAEIDRYGGEIVEWTTEGGAS